MTQTIPQDILDALTDVDMPRLAPEPGFDDKLSLAGHVIPVHRAGATVRGCARRWNSSGAVAM